MKSHSLWLGIPFGFARHGEVFVEGDGDVGAGRLSRDGGQLLNWTGKQTNKQRENQKHNRDLGAAITHRLRLPDILPTDLQRLARLAEETPVSSECSDGAKGSNGKLVRGPLHISLTGHVNVHTAVC